MFAYRSFRHGRVSSSFLVIASSARTSSSALLPLKTLRRLIGSLARWCFAARCDSDVIRPREGQAPLVRGLHGKDDAELGFAAHHMGVGVVDSVEGEFLDHGAHAG